MSGRTSRETFSRDKKLEALLNHLEGLGRHIKGISEIIRGELREERRASASLEQAERKIVNR